MTTTYTCHGAFVDGKWTPYDQFHPKIRDIVLHNMDAKSFTINGQQYRPKWSVHTEEDEIIEKDIFMVWQ